MISIFKFLPFLRSCTYNVLLSELVIVLDMYIDNEHTSHLLQRIISF